MARALQLSAEDLRAITDWPDALIEEFLSLIDGQVEVQVIINNTEQLTNLNISMANIKRMQGDMQTLAEQVNQLRATKPLSVPLSNLESQLAVISSKIQQRLSSQIMARVMLRV